MAVTYNISGLLRCCEQTLQRHGEAAEADGQTSLTCAFCQSVITRGDDGVWRWDSTASARTVKRDVD